MKNGRVGRVGSDGESTVAEREIRRELRRSIGDCGIEGEDGE